MAGDNTDELMMSNTDPKRGEALDRMAEEDKKSKEKAQHDADEDVERADKRAAMDPHFESLLNKMNNQLSAQTAGAPPANAPQAAQPMPQIAPGPQSRMPNQSVNPGAGQPNMSQMPPPQPPVQPGMPPAAGQPPVVTQGQGSRAMAFAPESITGKVPTTMNNDQYTKSRLQDLETGKGLMKDEAGNLAKRDDDIAALQAQAVMDDKKRAVAQELAGRKAMQDAEARDQRLRSMIQQQSSQEVDPDRYWKNKSTGGKIMAGVGIMLGGLGSGFTTIATGAAAPNLGLQQVNKAIDQDIDAQKEKMNNNWKAISAMHGLDESATNRAEHQQAWENNFRTSALEAVKMQISARAAQSSSATVQNNAKQSILDITKQQDDIKHQNYLSGQSVLMNQYNARQKQMKELQDSADKDIQSLIEKKVPYDEAQRQVLNRPRYAPLVQSGAVPQPQPPMEGSAVPSPEGKESVEQLGKRTVLVNGQPKLAVNDQAAKDYHDYSLIKPEADRLLNVMMQAEKDGQVAPYEAARGKLIEVLPKIYGYNRGPSNTQAEHTFGPDTIPEYPHMAWGSGTTFTSPERAREKLQDIRKTLSTIDESMDKSTFQSGTTDSSSINNQYNFKPAK